jgi:prepilin-type N-terminal cleavage/methylation domain-containing protein
MRSLIAARERLRARDDSGMTLIELVVTMTIFLVLMSVFTTGLVQMYASEGRTEAIMTAQSQMHNAFVRLDREIRYASAISTPDTVGVDSYVEYLTTNTGIAICTELRLNIAGAQLQWRTWTQGSSPLTPTAWSPLASGVSSGQPFTFVASENFQRLRVQLAATPVGGVNVAAASDITFTALNTQRGADTPDVCTEGRTVP